ncbi:EF-hand domain-containing protein [uncultured Pseudacidovorax sp.]|uniref:EF-hand domain-containing protein n=1 Tax=uncultured Pseudacidovorax sp. TaxID=679313 RepID=UPI0025EF7F9B|nr:EF-hand domain-containing protein [uncultured Pseudacidovorax sp.]
MTPQNSLRLATALACLVVGAARAQSALPDASRREALRSELTQRFAAADTNADGRLSRDEAKAGMPRVYRAFDAIDSTHAGSITLAQIEAYLASQRGKRGAGAP